MKIKSGDTLSGIAKRNGTTVAKLLAANPSIKNANSIRAGQSIMLPESLSKNSPNYTGKRESNPYKGTDLSTLQMRGGNKSKAKVSQGSTMSKGKTGYPKVSQGSTMSKGKTGYPKVSQGSTMSKGKTGYPKVSQGSTMAKKQAPKKKSFGSKFMSFIKGEGSRMKKDLDNAVSETKRNFGPGRLKSSNKSKLNSKGNYKGTNVKPTKLQLSRMKKPKNSNLAMQKKQQSKKLKNQMST
jgi:hypothetical protein